MYPGIKTCHCLQAKGDSFDGDYEDRQNGLHNIEIIYC